MFYAYRFKPLVESFSRHKVVVSIDPAGMVYRCNVRIVNNAFCFRSYEHNGRQYLCYL